MFSHLNKTFLIILSMHYINLWADGIGADAGLHAAKVVERAVDENLPTACETLEKISESASEGLTNHGVEAAKVLANGLKEAAHTVGTGAAKELLSAVTVVAAVCITGLLLSSNNDVSRLINWSNRELEAYDRYLDAIRSAASQFETACLNKGLADGLAEGKIEGKIELAKALLKLNLLSVAEIAKSTGLSVKQIESIKNQN